MKRLVIIGCLLFYSLNCFSTCIAIYVAKNGRIYVAADSKRTFYFNDQYKSELICKIHNVGDNYFAISGIDDGGLLKAANIALQQHDDIEAALGVFEKNMVARYTSLMTNVKQYYPDKFKHFLQNGLASVCFFGYRNNSAYVVNVHFLVYLDDNQRVAVAYRTELIPTITVIGISEDIPKMQPNDQSAANPELYVESLVKIEAVKKPLDVSEPIDLLELSPEGPKWIRRNDTSDSYN